MHLHGPKPDISVASQASRGLVQRVDTPRRVDSWSSSAVASLCYLPFMGFLDSGFLLACRLFQATGHNGWICR